MSLHKQRVALYAKGNEYHQLGTGFFCQKRNISAVMVVEFVSDKCHIGDTCSTKSSSDYRLLGSDPAESTRYVPAFQRNLLLTSSG